MERRILFVIYSCNVRSIIPYECRRPKFDADPNKPMQQEDLMLTKNNRLLPELYGDLQSPCLSFINRWSFFFCGGRRHKEERHQLTAQR